MNLGTKGTKQARRILGMLFILAIAAGLFVYPNPWNKGVDYLNQHFGLQDKKYKFPEIHVLPFQLGLDIAGGTSLTYRADLTGVVPGKESDAMSGLRDVIERRVNLFGVKEPLVETAKAGNEWRLIVELAGIKDIHQAISMIGDTPFLEFRTERTASDTSAILAAQKAGDQNALMEDPYFEPTQLTGKFLSHADLTFDPTTGKPGVSLQFNNDGAKLFSDLTSANVGKRIAVYLKCPPDCVAGQDPPDRLLTAPVVQEAIPSGRAQITGNFTVEDARQLAQRLDEGALPVPITLIEQRTVGASLGQESLMNSIKAGLIGFLIVALFMTIYYRLFGFFAVLALSIYTFLVLSVFKLLPVTLTVAGIAGFILSIGMAVDANILIFSRIGEERKSGKQGLAAINEGFARAWPSIRDSNITTIITSVVLYTFATSIIKGFALTLLIGVVVSLFSSIYVTKTLLIAFQKERKLEINIKTKS